MPTTDNRQRKFKTWNLKPETWNTKKKGQPICGLALLFFADRSPILEQDLQRELDLPRGGRGRQDLTGS